MRFLRFSVHARTVGIDEGALTNGGDGACGGADGDHAVVVFTF